MSGRDVCFRRVGREGRWVIYLDGRRAGSSATRKGARALVVALSDGRIQRVEGGVIFRPATPFVIDLNDHGTVSIG